MNQNIFERDQELYDDVINASSHRGLYFLRCWDNDHVALKIEDAKRVWFDSFDESQQNIISLDKYCAMHPCEEFKEELYDVIKFNYEYYGINDL